MPKGVYTRTEETRRKLGEAKKGSKHPNWKGGKSTHNGYITILKPDHPRSHWRYVYEHILIAEEKLGRSLKWYGIRHKDNEIVHHINGIKTDNKPENLHITTKHNHDTKIKNSFIIIGLELAKKEFENGNIIFDKEKEIYVVLKE